MASKTPDQLLVVCNVVLPPGSEAGEDVERLLFELALFAFFLDWGAHVKGIYVLGIGVSVDERVPSSLIALCREVIDHLVRAAYTF